MSVSFEKGAPFCFNFCFSYFSLPSASLTTLFFIIFLFSISFLNSISTSTIHKTPPLLFFPFLLPIHKSPSLFFFSISSIFDTLRACTYTNTPHPIATYFPLFFVFCLDPWPWPWLCLRLSEDDSVTLKPYARTYFRVS